MIRLSFLFLFLWSLNIGLCSGEDTLQLVNIVFRHGDRSPTGSYPNNPNNISTTWPDGFGWLTEEGMRMEYSLGRFLRRRYDSFLGPRYINQEVSVQSSARQRCLMSAYSLLAGLFPPQPDQMFNANISWQPIPVETKPKIEDNMIAIDKPCERYDQLFDESLKSDRIKKEESDNKEFYDYLRKHTGYATESIDNIWKIADILYCEKQHGVAWPDWMNATLFVRLSELWRMNFDLLYHGREESRLKGGPLLKDWIRVANNSIAYNDFRLKMNMYSGHDTTDVAVMSALKVYNHMLLPYTTAVIMELHRSSEGDYHVELFMRNHSSEDPHDNQQPFPLTLPGCDTKCPYDKFLSLTKDAIPGDWDAECALKKPTGKTVDMDYKMAFIVAVAVYSCVLLILMIVVIVTCMKYRKKDSSFGLK